jgi:parallel beta-helix repeat protein
MHSRTSGFLKPVLWAALVIVAITAIALSFVLERTGVPPRLVAPYLERRASGHNPLIVRTGEWMSQTLISLDRGEQRPPIPQQLRIGAQAATTMSVASVLNGSEKIVASSDEAIKAIASARPGDVITFLPGAYRFRGPSIDVRNAGRKENRITVRAARLDTVFLEFEMTEGFHVLAPYWTFENLNIQGVCADHSSCEHAFHVVGQGSYFTARNNRIIDFNAHFKINGSGNSAPDYGVIEGNTVSNKTVRRTGNPVTPIDLVAASHWVIRGNLISDFIKGFGNQISYGAFAKGGGSDNRFEGNAVLCEYLLRGAPGQRVGLSLGNGGTGLAYCRDKRCITEQDGSIIQSNLIAHCSDDGIYINRSATSKILHNTLIDTGGISVRFAESSADIQGNLVDGAIRSRDGGLIRASENHATTTTQLYLGHHPVRDLYVNAEMLNLRWKYDPPRRMTSGAPPPDLCGALRPSNAAYGAFEDFSACVSGPRY